MGGPGEEMTSTEILQAQVRDARKLIFKLEEVSEQTQEEYYNKNKNENKNRGGGGSHV